MNLLRRWLERLFGLQASVEDQVENAVRVNVAVAGAMAHAEACKEAERYAGELEKTHPHLAARLRDEIAKAVGAAIPPPPHLPTTDQPARPVAPEPKKLTGRPKKAAELPAAPANGGN